MFVRLADAGIAGDGGRAVEAMLSGPDGVESDGADGGLVILDGGNNRVRAVTG